MFSFPLKKRSGLFVIAVALLFGASCGVGDEPKLSERVFEGLITGVEASTLLDIESIEVTDRAGTVLEFHAGGRRFPEFTPSHVREHMLQGLGVIVTYRESDGTLYIVAIRDSLP